MAPPGDSRKLEMIMKLRSKLIVTFLILILVPVMFTAVAFLGFSHYQINSIKRLYGVENVTYETLTNTTAMLSRITRESYNALMQKAETEPDAFEDPEYLDSVNLDLKGRYSFLVVRKDDDFIYVGDENDQTALVESLPEYGAHDSDQEQDMGIYIGGSLQALVRQLDFVYTDGSEGSAFIVTALSSMIPEVESLIMDVVMVLAMILIFTSMILTAWIYKSIVTPIHHLQIATKKITDGNLDFKMPVGGEDEIGELCTDFEEMRRRLKESAEEKLEAAGIGRRFENNGAFEDCLREIRGYILSEK